MKRDVRVPDSTRLLHTQNRSAPQLWGPLAPDRGGREAPSQWPAALTREEEQELGLSDTPNSP